MIVALQADRQIAPDKASIRPHEPLFQRVMINFAAQQQCAAVRIGAAIVMIGQILERGFQQIPARAGKQRTKAVIRGQDRPIGRHVRNPHRRMLERGAVPALVRGEQFFRAFAIVDLGARRDPARGAIPRHDRSGPGHEPGHRTIGDGQPVFRFELLARANRRRPKRLDPCPVRRMDYIEPAQPRHVGHRPSGKLARLAVDIADVARRIGNEDTRRQMLAHGVEPERFRRQVTCRYHAFSFSKPVCRDDSKLIGYTSGRLQAIRRAGCLLVTVIGVVRIGRLIPCPPGRRHLAPLAQALPARHVLWVKNWSGRRDSNPHAARQFPRYGRGQAPLLSSRPARLSVRRLHHNAVLDRPVPD